VTLFCVGAAVVHYIAARHWARCNAACELSVERHYNALSSALAHSLAHTLLAHARRDRCEVS